ncbi:MAG: hypothetical protein QOH26_1076 [Actinomycetota bacterium]|jgi:drug/metabolite transporter (DMT)-like permease|nr:hypothetical protein [Actinomycetota bacterium]
MKISRREVHAAPAGGAFFVMIAAAMWGSDAVFRRGLALELPASVVVFVEHAILVLLVLPLLWRTRPFLKELQGRDWAALIVVGAGASAVATILFTKAFAYGDPTSPLLLQKLQPLFALVGAYVVLKERLTARYGAYLVAALIGAYLITFPSPGVHNLDSLAAAAYAIGAAALWGMGTVFGRLVVTKIPFTSLTAMRFAIGLPAAGVVLWAEEGFGALGTVGGKELWALLLLALIPGLGALLIYYAGLRRTPAAAATIAELAFPLSAITLNRFVFGTTLSATQWFGVALLTAVVMALGYAGRRGSDRIGIVLAEDAERRAPLLQPG